MTLSTYAEQVSHYAAARGRLRTVRKPAPVKVEAKFTEIVTAPSPVVSHFAWEGGPEISMAEPVYKRILREVAEKHGVTVNDILSPRRSNPIVHARQEAAWRMKTETAFSYPEIGRRMGGKDHTTIMWAVKRYEEMRESGVFPIINTRL